MAEDEIAPRRRSIVRSAAKWIGIALLALALLAAALVFGINTDPGRRYVTRQINALEMASGLDIDIGRIEGSLYGKLIIHDLRLRDGQGIFFAARRAELDWRPLDYFRNHIDIRSLVVPEAQLARLPALKASGDPNAPILPDLDIDVGRLQVGRLLVGPAVTGQRHLLSLDGRAHIADGRAQVTANAAAIAAPGMAGGDRLALRLDAVPDANRFDVDARLQAPAGGFVAGLAGLDQPLVASVTGNGSWQNWRGRAQATLGGEALANLAVTGRDGSFRITGPVRPGLMFEEGSVRRLVQPLVQSDVTLTMQADRRTDLRARLQSQALAVAAEGRLDLGQSRYDGIRVAVRLLQPGAIAPNASGRDVRIALLLNGAFATPDVAYELQAAALGFDETVLENFRAAGRARVDADRITVPINARAARIGGLNPAAGGLLTNVTLNGSLAISGTTLLSDNMRIRSDRLNATAVIVADFSRGSYRAGLQGRIDNYLIQGIGLLDLDSDIDVVSAPGGGFGLDGRIAFRTRRIDNESARDFLGGNVAGSARIAMNPDGVFTVSDVRMTAPQFRITSGGGTYAPGGRINIRATAVSTAYGPLAVTVTGTVDRPQVRLIAANPGLGIGLRDIEAQVRSTASGYAITAKGQSDYGPFTADVEILSGRGPLTVQVNSVTIAGVDFQGRVVQTRAGPFEGTLTMAGSGLNGTVRLAAAGQYQQAIVSARAEGARIPGEPPILIQRGLIQADVILYPDAPQIVADAQLAGVRRGPTAIETARARINYRGGRGQAQFVANGRSGVPFRVAANVALAPDVIRAAVQGNVNRVDFRLARPAEIRKAGNDWQLARTILVLPQGNVELAGRYGDGLTLQTRFRNLDLSLFNALSPTLGLGGSATGSLDFAQPNDAAFPRADARILVTNFTRTGIATLSAPVNIAFAGQLRPEGGAASAVIRRGEAIIGRAQARLQPVSAEGSWSDRLLAAPLTGGIRYNGPAEVLWSLTGIADMQLAGPVAIAADFGGRVQQPSFNGIVRANALTFVDETYGTRITNLALQGNFDRSHLELTQFSGRAGEGTISGRGRVGLASAEGFPIDVRIALDNARLARSDAIGATVSGNVAITNGPNQPALISGELNLPEVRYQIVRQGAAEIAQLEGVRRRGEPLPAPGEENAEAAGVPSIWNLDLRVRARNEVFVSGMGLESEWSTDLRVQGTSSTPQVTGTASLIRGTYSFAGNRFELTQGEVSFNGSRPINPRVSIVATAELDDADINLNVTGSATNPQIAFSSSPSLPQDEIMARLLFGGPVTELSALQVVQLGASLNSLRGSGGGLNPLGQLRSATGLSRLRILGEDEATGRGTAISAGFYISNRIYVELVTDARGFTATQLEIALSRTLSLLSQASSAGTSNAAIRYRKQY